MTARRSIEILEKARDAPIVPPREINPESRVPWSGSA